MLAQLSSTDWQLILATSLIVAVLCGFITDSILGPLGLGVMMNAAVYLAGGIGGLFALDQALARHWVYGGDVTVAHWLGAWLAAATVLVLFTLAIRAFVSRNAYRPWVMAAAYLGPVLVTVGLTARAALTVLK